MTETVEEEEGTDAPRRRLAAKRRNERVKLLITTINTVALTTFGAALILPVVTDSVQKVSLTWIFTALALHVCALGLFRFLRSEE